MEILKNHYRLKFNHFVLIGFLNKRVTLLSFLVTGLTTLRVSAVQAHRKIHRPIFSLKIVIDITCHFILFYYIFNSVFLLSGLQNKFL